jgi:lipid kinase YegS
VTDSDGKSACLILHGKTAGREDVRAAVKTLRGEGAAIDVRVTWEAGDTTRFAREAIRAGCDVVIAGGGDGTVNEAVRGLADRADFTSPAPALAILPLGTANDLARACRIPLDPLSALRLAMTGQAFDVDVGQANDRWFLNVATGGFGTEVTTATPNSMKKTLGAAAYLVTGLTRFTSIRPAQARLRGADFDWLGAFLVLAVGNGRQAGGGHQLCPDAFLNDGLLDVRLLPQLPNDELAEVLTALLQEGIEAVRRTIVSARVPWIEIEPEEPMQINLDGEPIASRQFRFDAVKGRLQLKLPADSPVLHR